VAKTHFPVRFASALGLNNNKLLTKHVRQVSQRWKQSDKILHTKIPTNPFKKAIFPVGIPTPYKSLKILL